VDLTSVSNLSATLTQPTGGNFTNTSRPMA
jgi:hypothetical protein